MRPQRYQPGQIASAWHRQEETGSMKLSDIVNASPVREVLTRAANIFLLRRMRKPQIISIQEASVPRTDKVDLSLIPTLPLNQRKQDQESDEADMLAETAQVRAIPRRVLPRDAYGRPYLVKKSTEENERLIPTSVAEYYRSTGYYPSLIQLKLNRYIKTGQQQYYQIGDVRIPYEIGWNDEIDIMLTR